MSSGPERPRERLVVCDCFTVFVGIAGPAEGSSAVLLALFLGSAPGPYLGLTTHAEFERASEMVAEHAARRPDKMTAGATARALERLEALAGAGYPSFVVREHPTVSATAADDHLVLLSAAAAWGAGYMTARNSDLLGIREFRGVKLRRPHDILAELPDADDLGGP